MQIFKAFLKVNLRGCDLKLWDWCAQYCAFLHNSTVRRHYKRCPEYDGLSPQQCVSVRKQPELLGRYLDENKEQGMITRGAKKRLRRFGCLAYVLVQPRELVTKLSPKRIPAVFVGVSRKSSSWLFARPRGKKLTVYESRDAMFCEDILVDDVMKIDEIKVLVFIALRLLKGLS